MSRRKLLILPAAALALALGTLANSAHAAPLIADISGSTINGGLTLAPNQSDYAQFTLTGPAASGSTIAAFVQDVGGTNLALASNFSAAIVNDNAGLPGATTILSSTSTMGTLSTSIYDQITFTIPSAIPLLAGTYWLEITHANVSEDSVLLGYSTSNPTNIGTDGTVNPLLYDGSTVTNEPGIFNVTGTVPEPMSLTLLALGAPALLLRRRKAEYRA